MIAKLRIPTTVLLLLALVLTGVALHGVNRALEQRSHPERSYVDVGPLPDGKTVRVLSLGFDRLIADLFWLRTIYYVGDERSSAAGMPAASRLAQLVTDIDPSFATVYVVMSGAIGFLQRNPDAAIQLLEKGVENVDYWKLNFLLGFSYFSDKMDYARAARQFELAVEKGGGPPYLPLLAARLYASAGDPNTALAMIAARLEEEEQPETREALKNRLRDLWIARDLAAIDRAIDSYRAREGRDPANVADLVAAGALQKEPRDPQGGPYRIEGAHAVTDVEHEVLDLNRPYAATAAPAPLAPPPSAPAQAQEDAKP
jgi:hypothetical protein